MCELVKETNVGGQVEVAVGHHWAGKGSSLGLKDKEKRTCPI